jgi:Tfp pilus assembly protein PilX
LKPIPAAQNSLNFGKIRLKKIRGIALPIALILIAVVLIAAVALMRNAGFDSQISGNEADRVFTTEATDSAVRKTLTELQALPTIPEMIDDTDPKLAWWRQNSAPIAASFWANCATGPVGNKCVSESVNKITRPETTREYTVQRMVQPAGPPEPSGATSGTFTFFYRVAVLITLDNGSRAEAEAYVRRPQLVK